MRRLEGTVLYVSEYSSTVSAGVYEEYIGIVVWSLIAK